MGSNCDLFFLSFDMTSFSGLTPPKTYDMLSLQVAALKICSMA